MPHLSVLPHHHPQPRQKGRQRHRYGWRPHSLYAQRRGYLLAALEAVLGERLRVDLQAGGIHLLAQLDAVEDDRELARRANAAGLAVLPLSDWRLSAEGPPGLLLGFTNIASADEARRLVAALRRAIDTPPG